MSTISAGNTINTAFKVTADTTGGLIFTTGGANTTALTLSNAQAATFAGAVSVTGNATVSGNTSFTGSVNAPNTFGFKNRIINGAMMIDQRNAGASVTPNNSYTLDRWVGGNTQASKFTVQQVSSAPSGFVNSLKVTSSSAYSVLAGDTFYINQRIEGLNCADLNWGTANAKTVTISFWVQSSLTGTFGGSITNADVSYSYPFSYTISSANTWEYKTITVVGPANGSWLTTNGVGIQLVFSLGTGSTYSGTAGSWVNAAILSSTGATSVVGTNGATFYITGVQLEVGSQATSFDFRDYGRELDLCQRYCYGCTMTMGNTYSSANSYGHPFKFPTTMRSTPSLASGASFTVNSGSAGTPTILVTTGAPASPDGVFLYNAASNWTVGAIASFTGVFTAEL